MERKDVDVLILGAGIAGLAAAREISASGLKVSILEARPRVGGRIHTIRDALSPLPVELGAEFLHGETPLVSDLLRGAGLAADEIPDRHARSRDGVLTPVEGFWEAVEDMLRDIPRRTRGRDLSMADYLDRAAPPRRKLLALFVEGFHAAPLESISARSLVAGREEDDRQLRIEGGYGPLVEWLRAGLDPERAELRLSTVVTSVRWKKGAVVADAETAAGTRLEPFRARAAVVTLPLGVLKSGSVRFEPELPSLDRLRMGHVFKILLRFRRPFWKEDLNFVHAPELEVPVWWTPLPARAPVLTGWAGGPRAERMLRGSAADRIDRSLEATARAFHVPRGRVDDLFDAAWTHDWSADPLSRGAYPYVGVGGVPSLKALARPLSGALYFAGDALDLPSIGTVGAALASGRRAGRSLARALGGRGILKVDGRT